MDLKNIADFENFVEKCRKLGVKTVNFTQFGPSIELHESALFPKTPYQKKKEEELTKRAIEEATMNSALEQEKALMWSAAPLLGESIEN